MVSFSFYTFHFVVELVRSHERDYMRRVATAETAKLVNAETALEDGSVRLSFSCFRLVAGARTLMSHARSVRSVS